LHSIEKASGNLASHISVHVVDGEVDRISYELEPLTTVTHCVKLGSVDLGESNLLDGGSSCLGLVRRWLHVGDRLGLVALAGRHGHWLRLRVGWHALRLGASSLTAGVASSVAAATVVLSAAALLIISLVLVEPLLLVLGVAVSGRAKTGHAAHLIVHSIGLVSEVFRMPDPVHHLVLFLVVTFILEFLLGDPEVNRYGSVPERCHLVEVFDSKFGVVDVLVEDESLFVSGLSYVGVGSELDRDDWAVFLECLLEFGFRQIGRQVLDEKVRVEVFRQILLDRGWHLAIVDQFIFSL